MNKKLWIYVLGLGGFLFLESSVVSFAAEYFVSPQGDDKNAGFRESPWKTPEHAGKMGKAGDTVTFLPGDYPGNLKPVNSGTPNAPVIFRAAEPRQAKLLKAPDGCPVEIKGISHIQIQGMYIQSSGGWMKIEKSDHITIENCGFNRGSWFGLATVKDSHQIRLIDNDFAGNDWCSNLFDIHSSTQVLVEGNSFSRSFHTLMALHLPEGPEGNTKIVVRGNVFHSGWSRNFENFGHPQVLIENNIFTNAFPGGRSGAAEMKLLGDKNIFRFNRMFRNFGNPVIVMFPHREWHYTRHTRIYNNVFHDNHGWIQINSVHEKVSDLVFKNNVFCDNDPYGSYTHLHLTGGNPDKIRIMNNAFSGGTPDTAILWGRTSYPNDAGVLSISEVQSGKWIEKHGDIFTDNVQTPPLFESTEGFNYALSPKSPLRNSGAPLTVTRSAGKGSALPVEDPYYFYDGYGIEGETGDLIAIGSSRNQACVVKTDYQEKMLYLDRSVQWKQGEPVSLTWSETNPDIGAFEYGANTRPCVRVVTNKGIVNPGESVELKADIDGMRPPFKYRWLLGDNTQAADATVNHKYAQTGDYGIRLRVTDGGGQICVGVGYIVVESPEKDDGVLIHTTFDADDDNWQIYWRFYRPLPTKFEHVKDEKTGNGMMHIFAPCDGAMLSANIHPHKWDINKYPTVRIKYRIKPGTVLSIFASGFPSGQRQERHLKKGLDTYNRSVFLARTAPQVPDRKARPLVAVREEFEKELIADGEWHEIELDVRVIQKEYPEVNILEGLDFSGGREGGRGTGVRTGDEYWLDEIYIGR